MLTTKFLSRTVALAMTASVTLLSGCPTTTVPTDPTATATVDPSASASASVSATATATPVATATATPVATATATASGASVAPTASSTATINTTPSGITGSTGQDDISKLATFNGKVYDPNLVPVDGATVTAKSVDAGVVWVGDAQVTSGGAYVFRNAPVGTRIEITVTKDGWTTRSRSEVLKSNLTGDPLANVFDFSTIYSIQDEPEVTQLKINGRLVNGSSSGDVFTTLANAPKNSKPTPGNLDNGAQIANVGNVPNLTGVNSNTLDVEMTFSEPVRRDDVEDYFRITSQQGFDNKATSFTVDRNYSNVGFEWSADDKVVTFKTNKAVLSNRGGDEARYLLDFTQAFRDKTDRSSIDRRYFRFSPSQINDFAVFSVKNDEEAPKLLGITARDGGGSNDFLELRYSESMELINQASYTSGLVDQSKPADTNIQLYAREANAQAFDLLPVANNSADNNATLLGYLDSTNANNFRASYMVGRVLSKNVTSGTPRVDVLGTVVNTAPTKTKVISAKITNNIVLIELDRTAFDRDDRVIVSAGDRITGSYVDRNKVPSVNEDLSVSTNPSVDYSSIFDPSGRLLDSGDSSTSANIDVTNKQRVATAS